MNIRVRIAAPLRRIINQHEPLEVSGSTIADCLNSLELSSPGIKKKLYNDQGKLYPYINIYLNGDNVRFLQDLATPVNDGDEVSIVLAIAGG